MKKKKDKKDIYQIGKTSYVDIAKAMDYINEYTIKIYCGYIDGNAGPHEINSALYKKNRKLNSVVFQFAIDIMRHGGYIEVETTEPKSDSIKNFIYTDKGIDMFFKGGFMKEIKKKRREKMLMITGQISIILAGLYYLFELLDKLL